MKKKIYLEELAQVEWSVSKKQKKGRAFKTKTEDKEINSITFFNLIQMQNLDLSEFVLIVYPKLIDFRLVILQ